MTTPDTDTGPLPHRPPVDEPERDTRVVDVGRAETGELFAALACETACDVLATLAAEPSVAPDVADAVDTSLQNAHYHLGRLREAGLIRAIDTWYSSRGAEMTVYAPVYDRLVVDATADGHPGDVPSRAAAPTAGD